jgi:hypothetical protein
VGVVYFLVMALTRSQQLRLVATLPTDHSLVVHRFPDGWTVRRLLTRGDEHREGELMRHCWSHIDKADPEGAGHPDHFQSMCFRPDGIPTDLDVYFAAALASENEYEDRSDCYSLRDPDNLPRVSFYLEPRRRFRAGQWTELGLKVANVRGHGNTAPRRSYSEQIRRWAATLEGPIWYDDYERGIEPLTPAAIQLLPRTARRKARVAVTVAF